jgi:ABC-type dipeptide/oligopeptide/nickel transport system permease component
LSLRPLSQLTRLMKTAWLDSLGETFIRTARAKGLDQNTVLWRHGLRFSMSPLVAWLPSLVLGIFSGSIFVEVLFSIPGLGSLFIESMNQRDYPVILGATFFYGLLTIVFTLISEVLRLRLDPRGAQ